jgi:hypothetical protein
MSKHTSHEMWNLGLRGWSCAACPFETGDPLAAIGHAVGHQYRVAPPPPLAERPRRRR